MAEAIIHWSDDKWGHNISVELKDVGVGIFLLILKMIGQIQTN